MVTVTYFDSAGERYDRQGRVGDSVMETAVVNGVPGIEAICGGSCVCGTCHVYVEEEWLARLKPPEFMESALLDASAHVRANSRLGCQIRLSEALNGITVHIPAEQG